MTRFPAIDMAGALRLTRQGRLKEAVAVLRGKSATAPKGVLQFVDAALKARLDNLADAQRPRPRREPAPEPAPGARFEKRSFSSAAGSRNYKLFVPGGHRGQNLPLVVMLHGCTQSADDFAAGTRMNALAQEQQFLVAYPEQARSANVSKCWNWFNAGNQQRGHGEAAIIAGITREVAAEFNVPPGRVYVAGLSAGGAAAAILGMTYPELFAAIGVHSGLACGAASDLHSALNAMLHGAPPLVDHRPGRVTPAIVFHGDKDSTVNIANAGQVIAQAKHGAALRGSVTEGQAQGMGYTRTVFSAGGRAVLEEWVLHGAGHAWSGGSSAGSFTDEKGPDASREMLRFFLSQPG